MRKTNVQMPLHMIRTRVWGLHVRIRKEELCGGQVRVRVGRFGCKAEVGWALGVRVGLNVRLEAGRTMFSEVGPLGFPMKRALGLPRFDLGSGWQTGWVTAERK